MLPANLVAPKNFLQLICTFLVPIPFQFLPLEYAPYNMLELMVWEMSEKLQWWIADREYLNSVIKYKIVIYKIFLPVQNGFIILQCWVQLTKWNISPANKKVISTLHQTVIDLLNRNFTCYHHATNMLQSCYHKIYCVFLWYCTCYHRLTWFPIRKKIFFFIIKNGGNMW